MGLCLLQFRPFYLSLVDDPQPPPPVVSILTFAPLGARMGPGGFTLDAPFLLAISIGTAVVILGVIVLIKRR